MAGLPIMLLLRVIDPLSITVLECTAAHMPMYRSFCRRCIGRWVLCYVLILRRCWVLHSTPPFVFPANQNPAERSRSSGTPPIQNSKIERNERNAAYFYAQVYSSHRQTQRRSPPLNRKLKRCHRSMSATRYLTKM